MCLLKMLLNFPYLSQVRLSVLVSPCFQLNLLCLLVLSPQHSLIYGQQAVNSSNLKTDGLDQLAPGIAHASKYLVSWYIHILYVLSGTEYFCDLLLSLALQLRIEDVLEFTHFNEHVLTFCRTL